MTWARRFQIRQYLKGSLWVLPLVGCVVGLVAAQVAVAVDSRIELPVDWQYSSGTASTVLTAVVGAMIGLLGFVVTISVLVVQQATGTLSPRFLRLWYRDRLQKVVLATFAGTFSYAFALLRRVETDFVPNLGVTLAGFSVGVSLVLLLVYVNRFTHNLRPVAVAAEGAAAGQRTLRGQVAQLIAVQPPPDAVPALSAAPQLTVRSGTGGAIQAISGRGLLDAAVGADCVLVLLHGVGDSLPGGTALIEVHGGGSVP